MVVSTAYVYGVWTEFESVAIKIKAGKKALRLFLLI